MYRYNLPIIYIIFLCKYNGKYIVQSYKQSDHFKKKSCNNHCKCSDTELSTAAYANVIGPAISNAVISVNNLPDSEEKIKSILSIGLASYEKIWFLNAEMQAIRCPEHRDELLNKIAYYRNL